MNIHLHAVILLDCESHGREHIDLCTPRVCMSRVEDVYKHTWNIAHRSPRVLCNRASRPIYVRVIMSREHIDLYCVVVDSPYTIRDSHYICTYAIVGMHITRETGWNSFC